MQEYPSFTFYYFFNLLNGYKDACWYTTWPFEPSFHFSFTLLIVYDM